MPSDTPARCEPPEALRGVSGWHWIGELLDDGEWHPIVRRWSRGRWKDPDCMPATMARFGYRYLSPVPLPSEIAALVRAGRAVARPCADLMADPPARCARCGADEMDTCNPRVSEVAINALSTALAALSFKEIGDE